MAPAIPQMSLSHCDIPNAGRLRLVFRDGQRLSLDVGVKPVIRDAGFWRLLFSPIYKSLQGFSCWLRRGSPCGAQNAAISIKRLAPDRAIVLLIAGVT
jgi:hypothetical protein